MFIFQGSFILNRASNLISKVLFRALFSQCFAIISLTIHFVKYFLKVFLKIFKNIEKALIYKGFALIFSCELGYFNTIFSICQEVFLFFQNIVTFYVKYYIILIYARGFYE